MPRHEKPMKRAPALIVLAVCNLFLCCALIATLMALAHARDQAVPAIGQPEPDKEAPAVQAETEGGGIPIETFKKYALEYNVPTEFIQRFFPEHLVYPENKAFHYIPVDFSLPQNEYNWDNLVRVGEKGEVQYQVDGKPAAKKGIDVSEYQGEIDWEKVKADGVEYAIIRLGYRGYGTGKLVLDQFYERNMEEAAKYGVETGVYFFSQALSEEEAVEEARMVLENLEGRTVSYPVIIDMEDVPADARTSHLGMEEYTQIAIAFCEEIKKAGYTPMIYANTKWFASRLDLSKLTGYQKWFAQYYKTPFFPYEFQMLQYTYQGTVDGIKGDVDLNLCFTDYTDKQDS